MGCIGPRVKVIRKKVDDSQSTKDSLSTSFITFSPNSNHTIKFTKTFHRAHTFQKISKEHVLMIFDYLAISDLSQLEKVSKEFRQIAKDGKIKAKFFNEKCYQNKT